MNAVLFMGVSVVSRSSPLERLQAALFVDVFRGSAGKSLRFAPGSATSEDLFVLAQRILGTHPARSLFDEMAREQGSSDSLPAPSDTVIARLERELAGSIGAASAHAMVSRIAGRETVSMSELIEIANETQRLIETSRQLEEKSAELEGAARQLREVNERLRTLDAQKDEFLSQVSHELRTPMTSVRSFSEILLSDDEVSTEEHKRFVSIIHEESLRLTRLLDEILDASRLEGGSLVLTLQQIQVGRVIELVLATLSGEFRKQGVHVRYDFSGEDVHVNANEDRMRQALINLLSNALKYNDSHSPEIDIHVTTTARWCDIDVIDNGGGVTRDEASLVFEKFKRGSRSARGGGSGLGLAISRAIMRNMGGELSVEFAPKGTSFFRMRLAVARQGHEAEATQSALASRT